VIELSEMAEFVDNDVVGDMRRQKRKLVVEIEILFLGTASPAGSLVFDRNALVCKIVVRVDYDKPRMNKRSRRFFMCEIMRGRLSSRSPSYSFSPE
jgi:hypothetical protein